MKVTFITMVIGTVGTVSKSFVKGLEDLEITRRDHPNYSITEIGQDGDVALISYIYTNIALIFLNQSTNIRTF